MMENKRLSIMNSNSNNFAKRGSIVNIEEFIQKIKLLEDENFKKTLEIEALNGIVQNQQYKLSNFTQNTGPAVFLNEDMSTYIKLQNKFIILEEINQEIKLQALKDREGLSRELTKSKNLIRNLETELYQNKNCLHDLEILDGKLKKELNEKKKLAKAVENLSNENKAWQSILDSSPDKSLATTGMFENNKIFQLQKYIEDLTEKLENYEADLANSAKIIKESAELKLTNSRLQLQCDTLQNTIVELELEIKEIEALLEEKNKEARIKSIQIEALLKQIELKDSNFIQVKIDVLPEASTELIKELESSLVKVEYENALKEQEIKKASLEYNKLLKTYQNLEKQFSSITHELINVKKEYKAKISVLEEKLAAKESQNTKLLAKQNELENKLKLSKETFKQPEIGSNSTESATHVVPSSNNDSQELMSLVVQLNKEKLDLKSSLAHDDATIKDLSNKVSVLELKLEAKAKELASKENDEKALVISTDKSHFPILSTKNFKQSAYEHIANQRKKLIANEAEIKLLKETLKSVKSQLKFKTKEIQKAKKSAPKTLAPLKLDVNKIITGSEQSKSQASLPIKALNKQSNLKRNSKINISKSSCSSGHLDTIASPDVQNCLSIILKKYISSQILFEQEKDNLIKEIQKEDKDGTGLIKKESMAKICKDSDIEAALLSDYETDVNYKEVLEKHFNAQIQQIHQELGTNVGLMMPKRISLLDIKEASTGLGILHQHIWNTVVNNIESENRPDQYVAKQSLTKALLLL